MTDVKVESKLKELKAQNANNDVIITEVRRLWDEYSKDKVIKTEDKTKLVLPCGVCMRKIFHKLTTSPKLSDFEFCKFVRTDIKGKTKLRNETSPTKYITEYQHEFECCYCGGKICVAISAEDYIDMKGGSSNGINR